MPAALAVASEVPVHHHRPVEASVAGGTVFFDVDGTLAPESSSS